MSKSCMFFMPILILLQGAVYLWLSIWGLVLRECSQQITDIAKQPFQYVMDLIYFYDDACGQPAVLVPGNTVAISMNLTDTAEPTETRTFIFLICYVIISTMWILTSLWSMLTSLCSAHRNLKLLSFGSWFTVVLAGSVLDAVATGYHIHNLVHTTSANKTFQYLGITTTSSAMDYIRSFDEYFVAPSIVMACVSSRIILIWLLNLSGASNCMLIVLVQGFIYLGLSIWGLVMGKCSLATSDITNQSTLFTMDLLYLQGSCLWIILSLACMSAVYKSNFKRPVNKCLSALWLLAILGGSTIDGIAAGFYGSDIYYTMSAASTFQYLNITVDPTVDALTMEYLEEFDVYFSTPALIMTLLTCRVGILFLINIFGCGLCVAAMTNSPKEPVTTSSENGATTTNQN
ncbi:hypothetical protein CVS40_6117 [Lucilia cuprina]|nr:hypothetical protein CVS40_6117 [Lucilia cuprina]